MTYTARPNAAAAAAARKGMRVCMLSNLGRERERVRETNKRG